MRRRRLRRRRPHEGRARSMRIVVTGGAGFIGSNFVRHVLAEHPADEIVVLDKLTYAGNLENLRDVADDPRYSFVKGDICDPEVVDRVAGRRRRDRQLRRRDPRRPLHQRSRGLHPHRRDRHPRAARGRARPRRRPLPADLDRRGLRRRRWRAPRSRPTRCGRRAPTRRARPAATCSCWPTGAPTAPRS